VRRLRSPGKETDARPEIARAKVDLRIGQRRLAINNKSVEQLSSTGQILNQLSLLIGSKAHKTCLVDTACAGVY
jgi:hypothetical protein